MKTFLRFLVAAAFQLGCLALRADFVTGVAVVVNDSVITKGEIVDAAEASGSYEALVRRHGNDHAVFLQEQHRLETDTAELLVEDKLILHEFITSPYNTNLLESVIDDEIREIINTDYRRDRGLLIRTLHGKGLTYEMFRRQARERIIIRAMVSQNNSNLRKILISPLKIDQYYQSHTNDYKMEDQVKLRMIALPKSSESAPGSALKLATEILAKIDSGVPFDEMAEVYSSGYNRAKGGDYDWVNRTSLVPELIKAAFSLKPGEHSGVIDLPEACYLMMVEDVKSAHVRPLVEVRAKIEQTLRSDENKRLKELWIERLKRKSFVSYY